MQTARPVNSYSLPASEPAITDRVTVAGMHKPLSQGRCYLCRENTLALRCGLPNRPDRRKIDPPPERRPASLPFGPELVRRLRKPRTQPFVLDVRCHPLPPL